MKGPRREREGTDGHSTWFQLNTDFIIRLGRRGVAMVAVVVAALKHITFYEVKIKY